MIVFKILLVLGLCLPIAILAGYLINNLMSEYNIARKTIGQMWANSDSDRVYDRSRSGRTGARKRADLNYRRYERMHR